MKLIKNVRHIGVNGVFTKRGEQSILEVGTKPFFREDFFGKDGATLPIPWGKDINTTAGSPTGDYVADARWGTYKLTLASNNEAEGVQLSWADQLMIPAEPGLVFETHIITRVVPAASNVIWIGLCDNHTNVEDALSTTRVGFTASGNANLLVDTDDNTTDNTDYDTTVDLATDTRVGLRIEVRSLSNVAFFTSNSAAGVDPNWVLRKVESISALAANTLWQPVFFVNKTTGTAVTSFEIEHCHIYSDDAR